MSRASAGPLGLVVLLLVLVFPLLSPGAPRSGLQVLLTATCLIVAWRALRSRPGLISQGWGMILGGVTLLGVGDGIAMAETQLAGGGSSTASTIVVFTGYAVLVVGALQFERRRNETQRFPGATEAAIFALGALTPLLVFLVLPVLESGTFSTATKSTTIGYALADLVVMTAIARVVLTSPRISPSLVLFSAALLVSLVGDSWAAVSSTDAATAPTPIRMLWITAFVLFAAGLAHRSMPELADTSRVRLGQVTSRRRVWLLGLGQALPAATLAVAAAEGSTTNLRVFAIIGLLVSALVTARVLGLMDRIGEQSAQLGELARSDELTGLPNRRAWNRELSQACSRAAERGEQLAVALLDLDHFKDYNDTYGHPAGDRLLQEASSLWAAALRHGDVLARYGGEEFALLLPRTTPEEAIGVLDGMRAVMPRGQSFSAGVTTWRVGTDPESALNEADGALYQAKRTGRDRVLLADPTTRAVPVQLMALRPVVQPIVRTSTLEVVAYEALSRFPHSEDVSTEFSRAHDHGYGDIVELTALTRSLGLANRPPGVELFVNVSERAMQSERFWEAVPEDLTGIVVELHEDRHGLDDVTVGRLLDRFRRRGARIGLDDLGVRATDLARIVSLRPDIVTIDRSLVAGCDLSPGQDAVIRMLVDFAEAHDAQVCVEGIETPGELEVVRASGATYAQGYLLGRPDAGWVVPGPRLPVAAERMDVEQHRAARRHGADVG